MKIALTGTTGFIGSHILAELRDHGHEVTALVRDDAQPDTAAARGATPIVVDLYDRPTLTGLIGKAHAATHTASPGDATSAALDSALRRALEDDAAKGYYVIGNGVNSTVAELTAAAAVAADAPGAVAGSDDEARTRLGDYFAEVLLLDQGTDAAKAQTELGWQPTRPTLVDEFRDGSYRKAPAR